jgi:hypothetical protein
MSDTLTKERRRRRRRRRRKKVKLTGEKRR